MSNNPASIKNPDEVTAFLTSHQSASSSGAPWSSVLSRHSVKTFDACIFLQLFENNPEINLQTMSGLPV
jgi:hypothetical protein